MAAGKRSTATARSLLNAWSSARTYRQPDLGGAAWTRRPVWIFEETGAAGRVHRATRAMRFRIALAVPPSVLRTVKPWPRKCSSANACPSRAPCLSFSDSFLTTRHARLILSAPAGMAASSAPAAALPPSRSTSPIGPACCAAAPVRRTSRSQSIPSWNVRPCRSLVVLGRLPHHQPYARHVGSAVSTPAWPETIRSSLSNPAQTAVRHGATRRQAHSRCGMQPYRS